MRKLITVFVVGLIIAGSGLARAGSGAEASAGVSPDNGFCTDYVTGGTTASANCSYNGGEGYTGSAWALVNAATGTIKTYALAPTLFDASANGLISDSYTLHGSASVVSLSVRFSIDGSFSIPPDPHNGWYPPGGYVGASLWDSSGHRADWGYNTADFLACGDLGCPAVAIGHVLLLDLMVTVGTPFDIFASAGVNTVAGGIGNFGSTATISFGLPTGTWITSDGGYVQYAIPESETYTMMLAGLGLIGFAIRRRKSLPGAKRRIVSEISGFARH